jgi:hypothetical protein
MSFELIKALIYDRDDGGLQHSFYCCIEHLNNKKRLFA